VLVNILAPVIVRLFDAGLADLVAPAGVLVLSGILAEQAEDVKTAAAQHGLQFKESARSKTGWRWLLPLKHSFFICEMLRISHIKNENLTKLFPNRGCHTNAGQFWPCRSTPRALLSAPRRR